jgi:hypothetical protein
LLLERIFKSKMSGEWMKSSIADLIKAYKSEENLYNAKNKLYYNKQARNNSLKRILSTVQVRKGRFDENNEHFI